MNKNLEFEEIIRHKEEISIEGITMLQVITIAAEKVKHGHNERIKVKYLRRILRKQRKM